MNMALSLRRLIAPVCAAAVLTLSMGMAQAAEEYSASHLDAARKAISAIRATDSFDDFLPSTARTLKNELTRKDPNLEGLISDTVDEQALALAKRRGALEDEAARAYAKYFTESELKQIATFYSTDAGKKLLENGPPAMADCLAAFNEWRQSIAQDLSQNVGKALAGKVKDVQAPAKEPAKKK